MSLTVAEIEQILEDFIEKQNTYYQNSPMGKKTSDMCEYLKEIKTNISAINQNTGSNGTFSQANMNDLLSRVEHNRNTANNSGSTSNGTILETAGSNSEDYKKLKKDYDNELKSAATNSIKSLEEVSSRFGNMIKIFGKSIESIIGKLDENNKLYGELNKSGLEWSNSATNMALDINNAGFTVKEFSKILENSSGSLRALGGEGILHFMSSIEKTNIQLGDFGLGVDEYYKQSMAQADLMRVSGNIQQLNNDNIGNSFHDLIGKTIALSSAFGVSTQEFIEAQKKIQTSEVDRGLVRQVAQRTGTSENTVREQYVELQRISPEIAQSSFRRVLGGTDQTYAQNQDVIQGIANLVGRPQAQFLDGLRRAQHEAVRQGDIDAQRHSALGLSYIQDSHYARSREGVNNALSTYVDSTLSGQQYTNNLNRLQTPDDLTRSSTGIHYARMQGMGAIESMTNTQIQSFSKSLTSLVGVMDNMYTKQFPAFAENVNKITQSLGKMDSTISHFIDNHQNGLAATGTAFQAPSLLGSTLFGGIGAAGAIEANRLRRSIGNAIRSRRHENALKKGGLSGFSTRNASSTGESILENEHLSSSSVGKSSLFNYRNMRGLGRIAGAASAGLSLYDLYDSESHINELYKSGTITNDQASRMKWEDWGKHIGEMGGGYLGGTLGAGLGTVTGAGVGSIPLGIAGAVGGSYIGSNAMGYVGKGIGWAGYELTHLNNEEKSTNTNTQETQNHPPATHINTQNDGNNDQVDMLAQISSQLGQLIRVSQQMSRNIKELE